MKNEVKAFLVVLLFVFFLPVVIAASVTQATGGTNISSSTAGGNYTDLTGPVISEAGRADIGNGTIMLVVPSGFEFDASASITVKITRTAGTGGNARNINNVANGTSAAVSSKNSTHIVFTVFDTTTNNVRNSLTWQGVRVRPTAALPLARGNITLSGNSSIVGVSSGAALGALIETAVPDSTPPIVTVPAFIVAEATSSSGAVVSFTANATDNVDGSIVPTCIPSSGSTFPLGLTTVICNATDSSNNTATNSFSITVQDTTLPVITVPANIISEATNSSGATVTYTATASDNIDGSISSACTPASSSIFPLGTTIVTCNATDNSNNTGTNNFNITIQDAPPVVSVPANIIAEATSSSGAVVSFASNATDTIDGSLIPVCIPSSGTVFAIGTTTVTCNATDSSNNTGTNDFNVTVQDTTPPVITVPANMIAEAVNSLGAVVNSSASASDLVDGVVPASCVPGSGSVFSFGTVTVTCNATDSSNNTATNSYTITVQDTTPPVISVPANIITEAVNGSGAVINYSVSASDNVDGGISAFCTPLPGTFPLGTTTVACNATDSSNNTGTNNFNVTVQDTTSPAITVPADITIEATGSSGAIVSFSANATDIVDGSLTPVCNPASGSTFPLGTTIVTCNATDNSNNTGTNNFNVTVQDSTAPSITIPADIIAEAVNSSGAEVNFTVNVSDLVDGSPSLVCVPASGSVFSLNTVIVNCTANDSSNNPASSSFNVTVVDTTPPSITAPSDISLEATASLTSVVLGSPVFSDLVDSAPVLTNDSPASFPVGVTFVNWTVTDNYNNSASVSQRVEINDTTAPVITLLGSTPMQIALNNVYVDAGATAADIVDGNLTGSILVSSTVNINAPGTYLVTYNVNDTAGNSAVTVNRTVHVVSPSQNGKNSYQPFLSGFVSGGVIPSVSPFSGVSSSEPEQITPPVAEVVSQPVAAVNVESAPPEAPSSSGVVPKITGAFSLNDANLKNPVLWSSLAGAALLLGVLGYFAFRKKP